MAEIKVERKRPSVWRWVVLLLIVALLVWAIVELFGGGDSPSTESAPETVAAAAVRAALPG